MTPKLALAAALLAVSSLAPAQVSGPRTQSIDVEPAPGGLSFTYVGDGKQGFSALALKPLGVRDLFGARGLSLSTLVVNPRFSSGQDSYLGALLSYRALAWRGFALELGVGAKGYDVTGLLGGSLSGGGFRASRQGLLSVGLTIPIGR